MPHRVPPQDTLVAKSHTENSATTVILRDGERDVQTAGSYTSFVLRHVRHFRTWKARATVERSSERCHNRWCRSVANFGPALRW
jgi:hypothetical protein